MWPKNYKKGYMRKKDKSINNKKLGKSANKKPFHKFNPAKFEVKKRVYDNTGDGCMVGMLEVYLPELSKTVWVSCNDESANVYSADFAWCENNREDGVLNPVVISVSLYEDMPDSVEQWSPIIKEALAYVIEQEFGLNPDRLLPLPVAWLPDSIRDKADPGYLDWLQLQGRSAVIVKGDAVAVDVDYLKSGEPQPSAARAAIYCRTAQEDDVKIEVRKEKLLKHANKLGYTNVTEYIDNGANGMNFERPGFKIMCADIEAGKINAVIVSSFQDIERDQSEASNWIRELAARGVSFISKNDNFDNTKVLSMLFETAEKLVEERAKPKKLQKWPVCKICKKEEFPGEGCGISTVYCNDKKYERIKAGDKLDFMPNMAKDDFCHDCNVRLGQYHHFNCDAERCPACNMQMISCGCDIEFEKVRNS